MNRNFNFMSRLMRTIMTEPLEPEEPMAKVEEAGSLSRELAQEFIDELWKYRHSRDAERNLFDPTKAVDYNELLQAIEEKSPDRISFVEIERLSRERPDRAMKVWEKIRAAARQDIANGWHAARSVSSGAWDRSIYLAIREQYQQVFPPRNGVESMLIDEIAQYETLRRALMTGVSGSNWGNDKEHRGQYLSTAAKMQAIDRLQRLSQYTIRTLVNLRRSRLPAIVARPAMRSVADTVPMDASLTSTTEEAVT